MNTDSTYEAPRAKRVEVVTSVDRRRHRTAGEKKQIVEETYAPGWSVSSVARKHGIAPSQLFAWKRKMEAGALSAVGSEEEVVPVSELKKLGERVRGLERLLGQKTEEVECLKEAVRIGREKTYIAQALKRDRKFRVSTIVKSLDVSRSNIYEKKRLRVIVKLQDKILLPLIKDLVATRPSYGYRRITILLTEKLGEPINAKRVYRIMRQNKLLLAKFGAKPVRVHDGKVATIKSNLRWRSDCFGIRCWNGDQLQVAFSLDCHDREVMTYISSSRGIDGEMIRDLMTESIETRFGPETKLTPHAVQWLSDNGPCYTSRETVHYGRSIGLDIRTTPSYSPESNGMAEAFVKTFKRDYVWFGDLSSAARVREQLPSWFEDYNEIAPHKALKMKSPRAYRRNQEKLAG